MESDGGQSRPGDLHTGGLFELMGNEDGDLKNKRVGILDRLTRGNPGNSIVGGTVNKVANARPKNQ